MKQHKNKSSFKETETIKKNQTEYLEPQNILAEMKILRASTAVSIIQKSQWIQNRSFEIMQLEQKENEE